MTSGFGSFAAAFQISFCFGRPWVVFLFLCFFWVFGWFWDFSGFGNVFWVWRPGFSRIWPEVPIDLAFLEGLWWWKPCFLCSATPLERGPHSEDFYLFWPPADEPNRSLFRGTSIPADNSAIAASHPCTISMESLYKENFLIALCHDFKHLLYIWEETHELYALGVKIINHLPRLLSKDNQVFWTYLTYQSYPSVFTRRSRCQNLPMFPSTGKSGSSNGPKRPRTSQKPRNLQDIS